ncbi:D-inositol 3-phosphate glycosyltransferase-like [Montipora capricornis]|uniref:D-inositol 3-phosphate glycosyltransferase-like n=1 Tax=Montipora capricornis TaxID=246305 RepID=UPI0035F1650E
MQEDRTVALSHGIKILEAKRLPGYEELEKLSFPPTHLEIDVIVGHGVKLGHQAQVIRNSHKCKWIQVIHTDPEELGMFKSYENPILRGEEKHNVEVELCEMADFVVAIGPKLAEAFRKYLRFCQKHQDVFDLTPGIFEEFVSVQHVPEDGKYCSVLVFGRGDAEDFTLKGFDIAAKAVAALPETSLMFVGAPDGKHEDIAKRLLEFGLPEKHRKVRGYVKTREALKRLFHEVDIVLMPSRTEGFGLTGLEALSAGLPVIDSKNSGFGEALSDVPFGSSFVIDSEDPNAWTAALKHIWNKKRQTRLYEAKVLRDSYGTKYSWSEQCKDLVKKMVNSFNDVSAKEQTQIVFTSESLPSSSVASLRTEVAVQKGIKSRLELLSLANQQKKEGKTDLAEFIANRGYKAVEEALRVGWEMEEAPAKLERNQKTRMEILQEFLQEECVSTFNKKWLTITKDILQRNSIPEADFTEAVRNLLVNGRGKYRNILLKGPANCGKTFILNPLNSIFHTFSNPATTSFAWVGAQDCEVIFLNDFR